MTCNDGELLMVMFSSTSTIQTIQTVTVYGSLQTGDDPFPGCNCMVLIQEMGDDQQAIKYMPE